MSHIPRPHGLSDKHWDSLSVENQRLYGIVRPMPDAAYTVDWPLSCLEKMLYRTESHMVKAGGSFDLIPDFQRGHVWTDAQRTAFVESLIRGTNTGRILFNCPGWLGFSDDAEGDIPENTFQCIDGLQRLTAVRKFMAGELPVFGGMRAQDLEGSPFDPCRTKYGLKIAIYEFRNRAELLQFYLDLNSGGTVHDPKEIERVRGLLAQAQVA